MTTADMAMRMDPIYEPISKRFLENPDAFADAFAKAWYKLTHRDMGPVSRYLGPEVPEEESVVAGPGTHGRVTNRLIGHDDINALKEKILASGPVHLPVGLDGLGVGVRRSATSDKRGGANGARIRLEPQTQLGSEPAVTSSVSCSKHCRGSRMTSTARRSAASTSHSPTSSSWAGASAVEKAAKDAGHNVEGSLLAGSHRCDARGNGQSKSFAVLEPKADAFSQLPSGPTR